MEATDRVVSWRKSSRSAGNGSDCVEIGVSWRKSSRSGGNGGECVEVGRAVDEFLVRDTKNRVGGTLAFTPSTWRRFLNTN
jgi:hypothetical protein